MVINFSVRQDAPRVGSELSIRERQLKRQRRRSSYSDSDSSDSSEERSHRKEEPRRKVLKPSGNIPHFKSLERESHQHHHRSHKDYWLHDDRTASHKSEDEANSSQSASKSTKEDKKSKSSKSGNKSSTSSQKPAKREVYFTSKSKTGDSSKSDTQGPD